MDREAPLTTEEKSQKLVDNLWDAAYEAGFKMAVIEATKVAADLNQFTVALEISNLNPKEKQS